MPSPPPTVLSIAGFDPSSGAGITADIKTIAAHECYGISCITALTVQSTRGVRQVQPVDVGLITSTLEELASDFEIRAVHIGMLATEAIVRTVADFLENARPLHVVLDPILKSSSGADLLDAAGARQVVERLLPLAEVVTPNLDEATTICALSLAAAAAASSAGHPAGNGTVSLAAAVDSMRQAARGMHGLGARNVVVTGGDLEKAVDLLSFATERGIEQELFKADRQKSTSTHGTGCAFATAMACHLAHGRGLPEAVLLSKAYISAAITNAQPLGHGAGPMHLLYRMSQQRRLSQAVTEPETAHSRN
ncbi:MAG: hydroxymethylpyrimidine/phosphomethylpyrimidine kinase [Terriglobales bacterium]